MKYIPILLALLVGCVDHTAERAIVAVQAGGAQAMKENCLTAAELRWKNTKDPADVIIVDLKKCEAAADAVYTNHPDAGL